MSSVYFVDLILPYKLDTLTYSVPFEFSNKISIGNRVLVSMGGRKHVGGIVANIHKIQPAFETKPIVSILDEDSIINKENIDFWRWISGYYMCSIGEVMNAALPTLFKLENKTKVYAAEINDFYGFTVKEELLIRFVIHNKVVSIEEIEKSFKKQQILLLINQLLERKVLFIFEDSQNKYKELKISYVGLGKEFLDLKKIKKFIHQNARAKKQIDCINSFLEQVKFNLETILVKEFFLKESKISRAIYNALLAKGFFVESSEIKSRVRLANYNIQPLNFLNKYQEKALAEIIQGFDEKKPVLLHGVTSSGKTEVYIHLINKVLKQNRQVLYLLPEIGLTNQIITRLSNHFGEKVSVYHSGLSSYEKYEIWKEIKTNNTDSIKLILGVRSSILLPFSNLGLIIVDEEHEATYKQTEPAPRYQARDLAIVCAQKFGANVLLGSATPSIESYFNALVGKYKLVEILARHKEIALPKVEIIDMKLLQNKRKNSALSNGLVKKIDLALEKSEQVILFRNRRGFSPILQCESCGNIPKCKNCDVSLTYHKSDNQLVCHYCGYVVRNTGVCKECGQNSIKTVGYGTEKLEEEIGFQFSNANVARMDTDTMRKKNAYKSLIQSFEHGDVDILVGTQILAKGLDFKNVNTVGVLNVDALTNVPDFRSNERAFQLLTQVSGRAGRHNGQGIVLLQALNTELPLLKFVQSSDYKSFFEQELSERKSFYYPPFNRLIKLTLRDKNKEKLFEFASVLVKVLNDNDIVALGPIVPYIAKLYKMYNLQVLLKLPRTSKLSENKSWIGTKLHEYNNLPEYKSIRIIIDVDTYN